MLSLIGTLLGLLGSFIPELLKFFKVKEDHKHEIEIFKLQVEAERYRHEQKIEEINVQADITETEALYKHSEQKLTGWWFTDGLVSLYNSSVRPTITYIFMGLYGFVKYSMVMALIDKGTNWKEVGVLIWSSEDFSIFATILSFWFGARMMKYTLGRTAPLTTSLRNGMKKNV